MTRTVSIDRYRNIGIMAKLDAGRTTTTERLLAAAAKVGGQEDGVSGAWLDDRQITLTTAATCCDWRGCRINIVELPPIGEHLDEVGLDELGLSALDAALVVVDGAAGVGAETAAVLAQLQARGLASLVFVNKLDREDVDFSAAVADVCAAGPAHAVALQVQQGAGRTLSGLVDVVGMTLRQWPLSGFDAPSVVAEVPAALQAEARAARARIVEAVDAAVDVPAEALKDALRVATIEGRVVPVLCGSAFRNRGIYGLLDAVVDYLPSPSEVKAQHMVANGQAVERRAEDAEPFTGVVFQTVEDPAAGRLSFVRVYSGVARDGGKLVNTSSQAEETIERMVRIHANHAEDIAEARTGDIVALAGLRHTNSGDTLCDPAAPGILERMPAPAVRAKH